MLYTHYLTMVSNPLKLKIPFQLNKIITLLGLVFFGAPFSVFGQESEIKEAINQLLTELKTTTSDSEKVYILSDLSYAYADINPAVGLNYGLKAEELANTMHWPKGKGYVYNNLGNVYAMLSDYPKALENYFKSLKNNELAQHEKAIASNLGNIGIIYFRQNLFDKSLIYYQKSLAIERKLDNPLGVASDLNNIGVTYRRLGDFKRALFNFTEALKISNEIGDNDGIANNTVNIGSIYEDQLRYKKAIEYYTTSLAIDKERGNKAGIGSTLGSLGSVYLKLLLDTTENAKIDSLPTNKIEIRNLAYDYLKKSETQLTQLGARYEMYTVYFNLYELAVYDEDYKLAMVNYARYHSLKDSVFSQENEARLAGLEIRREVDIKEKEIVINKLQLSKVKNQRIGLLIGMFLLGILVFMVFKQRAQSEKLLLNILPKKIAERLKKKEFPIADQFESASIVFIDIVGFTNISEKNSPANMVTLLNGVFVQLDVLVEQFGLEKIKTIGDCYMAVGNLPENLVNHQDAMARFCLEASKSLNEFKTPEGQTLSFRTGIDCGPVVAGVIGEKKFIYDLWGDAVNTASRMESTGVEGKIQITERFKNGLSSNFVCELRGPIEIKGKGKMITYFLVEEKV